MLFALANPAFCATRTSTQRGSAAEIRAQFASVGPFSTTTIRPGSTPSEMSDSTTRMRRADDAPGRRLALENRMGRHVIAVNGRFLTMSPSGVQRYAHEILRRV